MRTRLLAPRPALSLIPFPFAVVADVQAMLLDVWMEDRLKGVVDVRVDNTNRAAVQALNLPYEVYIEDVQAQIDAQVANRKSEVKISNEYFDDYHTYEENKAFVDGLVAAYPDLLTPISIGTTHEGRDIFGVRLHGRNTATKAVVINSGQHAREWITVPTLLGMTYNMLTSYGNDSFITDYIDSVDSSLIFHLNPDGYAVRLFNLFQLGTSVSRTHMLTSKVSSTFFFL